MINSKTESRRTKRKPKMQRTQILLDPIQYKQLVDFAQSENQSISGLVRRMLDEVFRAKKRETLENAAEMMADVYAKDADLTSFSSLDGEDFIASR
jgi:hypothetical protein